MNFHDTRKIKFDKGALEHKQPWELSHIDTRSEIMDELLDIYNYAELHATKRNEQDMELAKQLMKLSKGYWQLLEEAGNKKLEPSENEHKLWDMVKTLRPKRP